MKISHVINSLATGGAERLVVNLATVAQQQGDEVEILVLTDVPGIVREEAARRGLTIRPVANSLKDPRIPVRLRKMVRDSDVVHVHLFPALYWASVVDRPLVFTEHSTNNRRIGNRAFALFEKFAYSRYRHVLAISEGVRDAISRHFAAIGVRTPVSIAFNGIDDSFFEVERTLSDDPTKVVSVGSLKDVKRHALAISAVAQSPNLSLKIAGEGPLRESLEKQIAELGVSDRVELLGDVANVPELLAQSDVLLSTSEFEGFSLVAVEAQATGIPVVGPNVPGFREVVVDGETGILYGEDEVGDVVAALETVLSPSNYQRFAGAARDNARKFSIQASYVAQRAVYEAVV